MGDEELFPCFEGFFAQGIIGEIAYRLEGKTGVGHFEIGSSWGMPKEMPVFGEFGYLVVTGDLKGFGKDFGFVVDGDIGSEEFLSVF